MSQQTHFALIDLGSNSFYMAIFKVGNPPQAIKHQKKKVQLRRGLSDDGTLTPESRQKALNCLRQFSQTLSRYNISTVHVVGTYTFRKLDINAPFLTHAEKILGQPINILSGNEEARLIFVGASKDLTPNKPRLFIDIGGGSTELTLAINQRIIQSVSLEIGCVSAQQQFFSENQLNVNTFTLAINTIKPLFQALYNTFHKRFWHEAIGSSGTIVAIASILDPHHQKRIITYDQLQSLQQALIDKKTVANIKFRGLRQDRENLLPGGLAILSALFECFDITELSLATGGLREGLIHELSQ